MLRFTVLALALTACAVDPASSLPADAAPLPQALQLSATPGVFPGDTVSFAIQYAAPGARIRLIGSNGEIGPGACPPALGGECVDITAGGSGYNVITNLVADASGQATFSATPPAAVPTGNWVFQAIDLAAGTGSNPVSVGIMCPLGPASPNQTYFDCTQTSACQVQTITCPDGQDCLVDCGGISSCQFAEIQCPNGGKCEIVCDNISACQIMEVFGGDGDLSVECSGVSTCQLGEVTCGTGNCVTTCDPNQSGLLGVVNAGPACAVVNDRCL